MRSPDGEPRPVPDLSGPPTGGSVPTSGESPVGESPVAESSVAESSVAGPAGSGVIDGSGAGETGPSPEQPPAPTRAPPPYPGPQAGGGYAGGPYPGPAYPGSPYPGSPHPSRPYPGQPYPGPPYAGQPYPGASYPAAPAGAWPPGPDGLPRVGPGVIGPPPVPLGGPLVGNPAPGPRKPHRWGFPAYLLVEGVFLGVSALLGWLLVRGTQPGVGTVAILLGLPTLCAATVAIVATIVRGNGPRIDLGLRFSWRDVGLGVAFGVGGLVLSIPAALIYMAIVGTENASSAVGDVFENLTATPAQAFLVFALVALVAPFCEEVVYRGLLWGAMEKHGANRWVAFALTTIIFALAHFEFTRTPLLLIVAIPIGLARALAGNLTASIVAHQINNLLPALALALSLMGALPGVA